MTPRIGAFELLDELGRGGARALGADPTLARAHLALLDEARAALDRARLHVPAEDQEPQRLARALRPR